jgi:hypothetical protein
MAAVTILTTPKSKTRVGALVFDALVSESHEFSTTVTQFPVEQGAPITDHARREPAKLTIEAVITNHPIKAEKLSQFVYDVASGRESILIEESVSRTSGAFKLLLDMIGEMDNYEAAPRIIEPVDVVTVLKLYKNMVITSISVSKDSPEEVLRFTMTLQKIRRASPRSTYTSSFKKTATGVPGAVDDKNNVSDQVEDGKKKKDTATSLAVDGIEIGEEWIGGFWKKLRDGAAKQLQSQVPLR